MSSPIESFFLEYFKNNTFASQTSSGKQKCLNKFSFDDIPAGNYELCVVGTELWINFSLFDSSIVRFYDRDTGLVIYGPSKKLARPVFLLKDSK